MRKLKSLVVPVVLSIAMLAFGLAAGAEDNETVSAPTEPPVAAVGMGAPVMAGNPGDAETGTTEDLDAIIWEADGGENTDNMNTSEPTATSESEGEEPAPVGMGNNAAELGMVGEAVNEVVLDGESGETEAANAQGEAVYGAKGSAKDGAATETLTLDVAVKKSYTVYYILGAAVIVLAAIAVIFTKKKKN